MMMYTVLVERYAQKQLMQLSAVEIPVIKEAIASLAYNPRPSGCKKLKGETAWRIRVGNYRVIYEIDDDKVIVIIVSVSHRKDVYRRCN
jgi:mRNA interferase RelE/StbE